MIIKNVFLFFLFVLNTNCQTKKNDMNSRPSHAVEEISEVDASEFHEISREEAEFISKEYMSEHHLVGDEVEMIKFLNQRTKEIHAKLLEKNPQMKAPIPTVYGAISDTMNAFAFVVPVCFPLNLEFKNLPVSDQPVEKKSYIAAWGEEGMRVKVEDQDGLSKCIKNLNLSVSESIAQAKKIGIDIDACFNRQGDSFVYNNNCGEKFDSAYGQSNKILYLSAADGVVFNTKLLKSLNESSVLTVLSHELAHYYRQHAFNADSSKYKFFYQLDRYHNDNHIPIPTKDQELIAIGNKLHFSKMELMSYYPIKSHLWLNSVAFNKFVSDFHYNYAYFEKECVDGSFSTECQIPVCDQLKSKLENKDFIHYFPFYQAWPKEELTLYSELESLAKDCLVKIPLHSVQNQNMYLDKISNDQLKFMTFDEFKSYKNLFEVAKRFGVLAEYKIADFNKEILKVMETANSKRLGFYTSEQNADEVALEINYLVGMNVTHFYESFLAVMKYLDENPEKKNIPGLPGKLPGELSFEQCKKALSENFTKFVPIAEYSGVHHSDCFRIYNGFREYQAHKQYFDELEAKTEKYKFNEQQWKAMQSKLPEVQSKKESSEVL